MSVERTTFEERLLPVLVSELTAGRAERGAPPARSPRHRGWRAGVIILAATALIATFVLLTGETSHDVITVTVTSAAMEPTLSEGAVVSVNTAAYTSSLPARGDLVAFRSQASPEAIFLSRVIGLPGDTVTESQGVVSVNGLSLDEPYARLDERSGSWTVEPGDVFVMGDNRPIALDSRWSGAGAIGQVPVEDLMGRVIVAPTNGHPDVPPGPGSSMNGSAAA